jgi:hypothetical protein
LELACCSPIVSNTGPIRVEGSSVLKEVNKMISFFYLAVRVVADWKESSPTWRDSSERTENVSKRRHKKKFALQEPPLPLSAMLKNYDPKFCLFIAVFIDLSSLKLHRIGLKKRQKNYKNYTLNFPQKRQKSYKKIGSPKKATM